MIVTQNMVSILPKIVPPDGVCIGCLHGKNHQGSFHLEKELQAQIPLKLIHNDLYYMINIYW